MFAPRILRSAALFTVVSLALGACKPKDAATDESGTDPYVDEGPLQFSPIVQYDNFPFQNFPVTYYIPPDPVAVVWLFHGSNGSVAFAKKIETIATTNELVVEGFGFIATESTDRASGKWDNNDSNPSTNEDLARLLALRDEIIATTDMTEDTPQYGIGFSGGGAMSTHFLTVLRDLDMPYRASHPNCSSGRGDSAGDIPIIWTIAVNDPQPSAESDYASRVSSGLPSELNFAQEVPIDPMYFTKNPSVGESASQKTYDEMVRLGMIDVDGNRIVPDSDLENWISTFEREANVASPTLRSEEIRVAWAMHRMNGTYAREVRDFFLDHL